MQRFFYKPIGYVRAIKVAGVDVSDTEANNLAQDRECTVVVCGRPEYMRTSQLHRAVPHAGKDQIIGELESASWQCCRYRRFAHGFHSLSIVSKRDRNAQEGCRNRGGILVWASVLAGKQLFQLSLQVSRSAVLFCGFECIHGRPVVFPEFIDKG